MLYIVKISLPDAYADVIPLPQSLTISTIVHVRIPTVEIRPRNAILRNNSVAVIIVADQVPFLAAANRRRLRVCWRVWVTARWILCNTGLAS
jgi:hypothetical protein